MSDKPHSADYFGDSRDYWWNRDFLELMSVRWKLASVTSVLDVGCGLGHWGRCLAPLLSPGCVLTGIDRETAWIDEARKRSHGVENVVASFCQGEAEHLPFPDAAFEMVTCQTVLIHLKDPMAALREMVRVLAPGGLIAIVEPNNIAASLTPPDPQKPVGDYLGGLELQLICEQGKMRLGEGFNSVGPFVAGWLSDLGLEQIESYLADKTTMLLPPHASGHQRAFINEAQAMNRQKRWIWDRGDTLRYFLAGGGSEERFEILWRGALSRESEFVDDLSHQRWKTTFGPVCFLVSGRKCPTGR